MKYGEMAQKFAERDKNAVDCFNNDGDRGIEAILNFVAGRAGDTAIVLLALLKKLAEQEDAKEEK